MSFPASPIIGQQHSQDNRLYEWDGAVWVLVGTVTDVEEGQPLPSNDFFTDWLPPTTNFPSDPQLGETFTNGVNTWEWDGVSWVYSPAGKVDWEDISNKPNFDDQYLPKAGGTLTGPLVLPGQPTDPNEAASKQYVDDKTQEFQDAYVSTAGDEMSGSLRIRGDNQGVEFSNDDDVFAEISIAPDGNIRISVASGKTFYYGGATPPQSAIFGGTLMSRQMSDNRYLRYLGVWDAAITYKVNEIVSYLNTTWLCLANGTTDTPDVLSPNWVQFGGNSGGLPPAGEWAVPAPQTFDEDTGIKNYALPAATGDGLTWTYSPVTMPTGLSFNSATRTLSINTDVMERGAVAYEVEAKDQFGRTILNEGFVNITPAVPDLATATDDNIFWTINLAIAPYDITQNFELNGNNGSFGVTGLPTGLSVVGNNIVGTPTVAGTGTVVITFTDSFAREVASSLEYEVEAAAAIFSNFQWDEATGSLLFDVTQAGTYTWHFGSNSGTFNIVAGANSPTINLNTYAGQTAVFRITRSGQELYVDANLKVPDPAIALSSPIGVQTGQTTASGSVTSDTATGTLYAGVWPAAAVPTAPQIKDGAGAVYHTTDGTPTAGVNNFSATGLTAATSYKWHYYQEDGADVSNVSRSAQFTTATAPTLIQPVILDCVFTSTASNVNSFSAGYPAHEAGDALLVVGFHDDRVSLLTGMTVTPLSGDTMFKEQAMVDNEINNNTAQGLSISSCVATANRPAAASGLVCTLDAASDGPFCVGVIRVQKNTFKDTTPRLGHIAKAFENANQATMKTAALTDVKEKSTIFALFNIAFNIPVITLPPGWFDVPGGAPVDVGAVVMWVIERDAAATDLEDVAQQTVTSSTNSLWVSLTGAILPKGA